MAEYEERALVWQKISGSEKLYEIYGYYPTLHDAHVLAIDCNFEKKEICITFYYSDLVGKADTSVLTLITLCWGNIVEADFIPDGNNIYHVGLKFVDNLFETKFADAYFDGKILCEYIKVAEIVIESDRTKWTTRAVNTTKLSYR